MEIVYAKSKKQYPKLREIPPGTVFSPIDSREIYIKLRRDGMSDIFTDSLIILRRETLNIQGCDDDFKNYEEIIAVTHLNNGLLAFMNRETRVVPLDCKLVVKG